MDVEEFRVDRDEKVKELVKREKVALKTLDDYREAHGKLELFFGELQEAIGDCKLHFNPAPKIYKPPQRTIVESPCSVVMCANDWHYGAVQDPSEIEGFGEYSPDICKSRAISYQKKIIDWVKLHRANYRIDECVVMCLGDLVSGAIHEELKVTNAFPLPVQASGAGVLLAEMVAGLTPYFKSVRVEFVVADNHARLTKKPQSKEEGQNSMNYVVGFIAREVLKKLPNVKFNLHTQHEVVVEVSGRRYLLMHGHGITGWNSLPWYGLDRRVAREALKRFNAVDLKKFHKVILGHWHTPIAQQYYWISGSLSGTDAYDHKSGRQSDPSQAAWFVHPRYGEFDRTDFIFQ